jgi:hypothetical protein
LFLGDTLQRKIVSSMLLEIYEIKEINKIINDKDVKSFQQWQKRGSVEMEIVSLIEKKCVFFNRSTNGVKL